jgi:hypothetical protein
MSISIFCVNHFDNSCHNRRNVVGTTLSIAETGASPHRHRCCFRIGNRRVDAGKQFSQQRHRESDGLLGLRLQSHDSTNGRGVGAHERPELHYRQFAEWDRRRRSGRQDNLAQNPPVLPASLPTKLVVVGARYAALLSISEFFGQNFSNLWPLTRESAELSPLELGIQPVFSVAFRPNAHPRGEPSPRRRGRWGRLRKRAI